MSPDQEAPKTSQELTWESEDFYPVLEDPEIQRSAEADPNLTLKLVGLRMALSIAERKSVTPAQKAVAALAETSLLDYIQINGVARTLRPDEE